MLRCFQKACQGSVLCMILIFADFRHFFSKYIGDFLLSQCFDYFCSILSQNWLFLARMFRYKITTRIFVAHLHLATWQAATTLSVLLRVWQSWQPWSAFYELVCGVQANPIRIFHKYLKRLFGYAYLVPWNPIIMAVILRKNIIQYFSMTICSHL
jgi:hypothetical protein